MPTLEGLDTPEKVRARILEFETRLKASPNQIDIDLVQYFCSGVYMRQVFLPAGTLVTGRIHKHGCLNVLLQGEVEVVTEQGLKMMVSPCVFESPAGVKRAVRAISDTIWLTVHAHHGEERDGDAMADLLTVPSYEQLESHCPPETLTQE